MTVTTTGTRRSSDGGRLTATGPGGQVVAAATMRDARGSIYLHVDLAGGHRPPGSARELLDLVFASIAPGPQRVVHASVPLGAPDLLAGLQDRLVDVHTRPAGASCLVDAILPGSEP